MRIRTVFVAYPYGLGESYRISLRDRFDGSGVEFRYADERLENTHVMDKIRRMMSESDVSFFDITGNNPNVMLELGYALGAEQPGFVVVQKDAVDQISADITGWDQLRYTDSDDLAEKLYDRITKGRVPQRPVVPMMQIPDKSQRPKEILRELRFGIPAVDAPVLCIYLTPIDYQRDFMDRKLLGAQPYRASDLCDSVLAGPNRTHYRTFFWAGGFDYSPHPGPDFIEVFEGRSSGQQRDRITNFRVYTSGAVTYMQRLRERGAEHKPFLYLYMFEQIAEMAFLAMSDVRKRLGFERQEEVSVGAVLLGAAELRISEATPDFYPSDDSGRTIVRASDEIWIPEESLVLDGSDLETKAKDLADEMVADLRTSLE